MGGVAKSVKNVVKSPTRTLRLGMTGGVSELSRRINPLERKLEGVGDRFLRGGNNAGLAQAGGEDPATLLATTGGASLLANIALGANVDDTIAGYFGAGDFKSFYGSLGDEDKGLVDGVRKQLTSIQQNTELRNKAVQQVVDDFPNVVAQAAQARKAAGQEFDDTTKAYMDQALNKVGAKYAAGGMLSSGATAAASARAAGEMGLNKLAFQDQREAFKYDQGAAGWQARYNETNALRNFQNLMTQGAAGQGFSAVQASLTRKHQTDLTNAGFQNQQRIADQQSQDQLFGAIGGLAGTFVGGKMMQGMYGANSGAATGGANYNAPSNMTAGIDGMQAPRLKGY